MYHLHCVYVRFRAILIFFGTSEMQQAFSVDMYRLDCAQI